MFYLYDPRVTRSIVLEWFLVSYLFCLGRIYCHVGFTTFLVFMGGYSCYAALLLQGKRKEISAIHNTGEKVDNTEKQCLYCYIYIYT